MRLARRMFLKKILQAAAFAPAAHYSLLEASQTATAAVGTPPHESAKVAVVPCKEYGKTAHDAVRKALGLLGGVENLVSGKTVTIKLNLTGTNFADLLGKPPGETYMTHQDTVAALCTELFRAGAKRIRLVESTNSRASLEGTLSLADWDVRQISALGKIEFENTRNLGSYKSYATLPVKGGGYMFSSFTLNKAYEETDVFVSMAKLKNHVTAGVTLAMKNAFGISPNSLYSAEPGNESSTEGRSPLHGLVGASELTMPGLKSGAPNDPGWRVPRITADLCAARPIHLAFIDGITSVSGGEGPWCEGLKAVAPGLLIVGFDPVATDAVGTALMGYENPAAPKGVKPFAYCDNHLLLAQKAGVGTAELSRINVRGSAIRDLKTDYGWG